MEQVQFCSIKRKNVGAPHTVLLLSFALSLEGGNVREVEVRASAFEEQWI